MKKRPIRTCVACRKSCDKGTLVRVVRTTQGSVCLDSTGKTPGRGAYLCGHKECLKAAIKYKKLSRALQCEIPAAIAEDLEGLVGDDADNDG
ncbi:MAG: RNase P modulator RnpM [Armatimonadota bacterium]|jgi:predicted RNA-binding protein YlxR (DUF448 family)